MHGIAIIPQSNQLQANRGHGMSYESAIVIILLIHVNLMLIAWWGGR
jgi:hypothetical protein